MDEKSSCRRCTKNKQIKLDIMKNLESILTHLYDRRKKSSKSIKPKKIHEVLYEKPAPKKSEMSICGDTNCGA